MLKTNELKPFGIGTITDKQKLRTVLQQSKLDGYTISYSELEDHTSSVAVQIFVYEKSSSDLSAARPDVRTFLKRTCVSYHRKSKTNSS
nr:IclR family transcriptional regulator C-terminal domain-containing protein [Anaerobacillus alkalilacustris]